MDRRVKARLVGASILVLLIVLIVPELLSGPAPAPVGVKAPVSAPEPVRNVTVDLATAKSPAQEPADASSVSSAQPPETQIGTAASAASGADGGATPVADRDATPAASPPSAPPARTEPSEPLERAPPAPTKSKTAAASIRAPAGHAWSVQLGSFASRANAEKLARQVKAQGLSVYIAPGGSGASLRYRVRTGPMADRGAAAREAAKLKALGHPSTLVSPGP